MNYTYTSWKGNSTTYAYPTNQKHYTKNDTCINIPGKPNPIKQWRKQLAPYVNNFTVQSHPTIQDLEQSTKTQSPTVNLSVIYENVEHLDKCKGVEGSDPCSTGSFAIRRSANTVINKKFCWNSKQYLQSRCKTFDQNSKIGVNIEGSKYLSGSCIDDSKSVCKNQNVIYKPNNTQFAQEGGVSSSARIAKLKYDTIRYTQNKYDKFLANLDNSNYILNRKPVQCVEWKVRGKRPFVSCTKTASLNYV